MPRHSPDHSALIDLDLLTREPAARGSSRDASAPSEPLYMAFEAPDVVAPLAAVAAPRASRTFPRWAVAISTVLLTSGVALAAMVVAVTADPEGEHIRSQTTGGPEAALREAVISTALPEATAPREAPPPSIIEADVPSPAAKIDLPIPPVEPGVPDVIPPTSPTENVERRPEARRKKVRRTKSRDAAPRPRVVERNQDEDAPPPKAIAPPPKAMVTGLRDTASPEAVAAVRPSEAARDEVEEMLRGLDEPAGEPVPPRVVEIPAPQPRRLGRSQVMRSIRPILSRISACPGTGTYNARMTVVPAGRVSALDVTGPDAAGRLCVEGHVRGLRFPRFGGDPVTLNLPFKT